VGNARRLECLGSDYTGPAIFSGAPERGFGSARFIPQPGPELGGTDRQGEPTFLLSRRAGGIVGRFQLTEPAVFENLRGEFARHIVAVLKRGTHGVVAGARMAPQPALGVKRFDARVPD